MKSPDVDLNPNKRRPAWMDLKPKVADQLQAHIEQLEAQRDQLKQTNPAAAKTISTAIARLRKRISEGNS